MQSNKTNWFITLLLLACMGGSFWYLYNNGFLGNFHPKNNCDKPIQYSIGNFDKRFGVSYTDFLSDIDEATKIWEKPIGKNLFEYNPNGKLVINLIYDERQMVTQQNTILQADINKTKSLAESVKAEYSSLEQQYKTLNTEYQNELAKFKTDQDYYTSQVDYWNSLGGAPKDEYNKLTVLKNNLLSEQGTLENTRIQINNLVDQINAFIKKYNLLVSDVNSTVRTINKTAGQEFQEGLYDSGKNSIDIYEFSDNQKLIRVLAHELGHALNLGHNSNPKSIMYAVNQSNTLYLSPDDIIALKTECNMVK